MTARQRFSRRCIAKALSEMAANTNDAPRIRVGKHAGRIDINALRKSQELGRA